MINVSYGARPSRNGPVYERKRHETNHAAKGKRKWRKNYLARKEGVLDAIKPSERQIMEILETIIASCIGNPSPRIT